MRNAFYWRGLEIERWNRKSKFEIKLEIWNGNWTWRLKLELETEIGNQLKIGYWNKVEIDILRKQELHVMYSCLAILFTFTDEFSLKVVSNLFKMDSNFSKSFQFFKVVNLL